MSAGAGAAGRLQGALMLGIATTSWGLNWPVLKLLMQEWPPFVFRVLSGAAGVALLVGIALWRREALWPRPGQWGRLVVASILNVSSWMGLASASLFWLAASEAAIIAYTMPIWAALLAWPFLGERPTWPRVAGLALGFGGVGTLLGGQLMVAPAAELWAKLPGVACILGTALMFAGGAVFTKRHPVAMAPVPLVAWQVAIGMTPVGVAALGFERVDFARITWVGWGCFAYVAVMALCVAYLAWFRALRLLPAGTAATGMLMVPVIGVLGSAAALGEPLGPRQLAALALTLSGVVLASRG